MGKIVTCWLGGGEGISASTSSSNINSGLLQTSGTSTELDSLFLGTLFGSLFPYNNIHMFKNISIFLLTVNVENITN